MLLSTAFLHNFAREFANNCKRICKQLHKFQQCVCWSKMLLCLWLGWKCNSLRAENHVKAINKLAYAYQKRLGYSSRYGLCSLLQCLHKWNSICLEQVIMSGANFRHCKHKDNGPAMARKDKGRAQVSNNNTHLNASVFSQNMRSRLCSRATCTTFCIFLKKMPVDLPKTGFERFVTTTLICKGRQMSVLANDVTL